MHIFNQSCQSQSIRQLVYSPYIFCQDVNPRIPRSGKIFHLKLKSHVLFYLTSFFVSKVSARGAWWTRSTLSTMVLTRVLSYPELESSIRFSHKRSCFASEWVLPITTKIAHSKKIAFFNLCNIRQILTHMCKLVPSIFIHSLRKLSIWFHCKSIFWCKLKLTRICQSLSTTVLSFSYFGLVYRKW